MTQPNNNHIERLAKASEWYAGQGWKILPCHGIDDSGRCTCNGIHAEPKDIGKHPAIGEWNSRATDDQLVIHNWWTSSPLNNIGVFCSPSGFIVIDIDPRSGGIESFEKLDELLDGALPKTVEAYTGRYTYNGKAERGRHLFFKVNADEAFVGNLKANGLNGIDIKHNGYVMLAPSRHGSGVNYEWRSGHAPWEIEMAEAPEALLEVIRKKSRKSTSSHSDGNWDWMQDLEYKGDRVDIATMLEEGIDEGSRAVDIYKLACALSNKYGVETPEKRLMIETLMIRFNYEKVRPPMELEGQNSLLMHVRLLKIQLLKKFGQGCKNGQNDLSKKADLLQQLAQAVHKLDRLATLSQKLPTVAFLFLMHLVMEMLMFQKTSMLSQRVKVVDPATDLYLISVMDVD